MSQGSLSKTASLIFVIIMLSITFQVSSFTPLATSTRLSVTSFSPTPFVRTSLRSTSPEGGDEPVLNDDGTLYDDPNAPLYDDQVRGRRGDERRAGGAKR